ncbi:DUF2867 domain-containing protein [Epilithonimonas sp.]|uniref:DUF2867 domain-containing protein n=1 Tax=Epilithonimonas sp. TaxID=2894511 RepID=UPI003FA530F4
MQEATFRPLGLWGRLYWYAVLSFHGYIFEGRLKKLADENKLFVLMLMMLFPISLIGTVLFVESESFKGYLLSAVLS